MLVYNKIKTLNLFRKRLADIQHGIDSTRIYIVLLLICMVILTIYSSIILRTVSVTVHHPTLVQYVELRSRYSTTLSCPCQRLSMAYSNIMSIEPHFHQVCSSTFVRDDGWLKYWPLNYVDESNPNNPALYVHDFRLAGLSFFTLLQTFCASARETILNALVVFNSTQFLTAEALREDEFRQQASSLLTQFTEQVKSQ